MNTTDGRFAGQNVEMEPLTGGANHSPERSNPNAILNECREIDRAIDVVGGEDFSDLIALQQRSLNNPDSSANNTNRELDAMASEIMTTYRNFARRIKSIKQQPESGSPKNAPQIGKVDRKLREAMKAYQNIESGYQRKLKDQIARQYRIVRPDASEAEVREAVEDTSNQQVFSQALLQSDRRGQSRSVFNAVKDRREAIQKIEQQMVELAQLFEDMDTLVVQQEAAVTNIEMKGEEVVENMDKGTQEIGVAIKSARNARKWKWWCLGICGTYFPLLFEFMKPHLILVVLIVVIIVIVILIYKFVIQNNSSGKKKRWVLPTADVPSVNYARVISGQPLTPSEKLVVPGLEWSGDNNLNTKPVVPNTEWTPPNTSGKWIKFAA
jgi:syntaxin 1B/2/3